MSWGKFIGTVGLFGAYLLFENIYENDYNSVFQNETLSWYKELHEKYGVIISCYCYYEDGDFNLSQFPDKYKSEFVERFPELSLFFKAYSLLDSEMICIFPYLCPYAESAREIREIFS